METVYLWKVFIIFLPNQGISSLEMVELGEGLKF